MTHDEMMAQLSAQKNEFEALVELSKVYEALPAIVDDNYAPARFRYETALHVFLEAVARNRKNDGRFILTLKREGILDGKQ
jgi:hypothetical protein